MMKIDAVITWVDGNDPRHIKKRHDFCPADMMGAEDKAGETRFANVGEIFWCIASLNRFAPWINKIFIVTDDQDPGVGPFLEENFPEGYIPVEIVDHKVIFRGYEEYLPTFNSISIETLTWRIPGLSDRYIEFNDDLMLTAPVSPYDFFTEDGRVICYGSWASMSVTRLTRMLKPHGTVTTKCSHANGASLAGCRWRYLRLAHCQKALRRDFFEHYYDTDPDSVIRNIQHRFRHVDQFTSQALHYIELNKAGKCIVKPVGRDLFFLQPKDVNGYFERKMSELRKFKGKFLCLNSIEKTNDTQRRMLVEWIERLLNLKFRND